MRIFCDITFLAGGVSQKTWDSMSFNEQYNYIRNHPHSRYAQEIMEVGKYRYGYKPRLVDPRLMEVKKVAKQIAEKLGYPPQNISVVSKRPIARFQGWRVAAVANHNEKITIFHKSFREKDDLDHMLTITLSHEIQHQKYRAVKSKPGLARKYKVYNEPENLGRLRGTGSITAYSNIWWSSFLRDEVKLFGKNDDPINETLAEIASIKAIHEDYKAPTLWEKLYNEINRDYEKLK